MSTAVRKKIAGAGRGPAGGLSPDALRAVAGVFKVLSEPSRLALLQELKAGPRSVGELVEALGMTQANVSIQLRILREARMLAREKRGNQVIYSLDEKMIAPLCELVCGKLARDAKAGSAFSGRDILQGRRSPA